MTDTLRPRDAKDVAAAVEWAVGEGKTLEIIGHGSKRAIGRPAQTDCTLDLSGLSGVTLYEPEELVLSAKAGTPIAEIEALVAAKGQQLAFEPVGDSRQEFTAFVKSEIAKWSKVAKDSGAKVD